MKIVVLDGYTLNPGDLSWSELEKLGECKIYNRTSLTDEEEIISRINIPTYGTAAVAQFAIALLLEICHHIGHHNKAVQDGRWENNADWCFWDYPLIELAGKTMGIIGYGRIGQTTAKLAHALGMRIIALDAMRAVGTKDDICEMFSLDDLFKAADVITPHISWAPKESRERLMNIAVDNVKNFLSANPVNVVN